jgi:hypothetical protein
MQILLYFIFHHFLYFLPPYSFAALCGCHFRFIFSVVMGLSHPIILLFATSVQKTCSRSQLHAKQQIQVLCLAPCLQTPPTVSARIKAEIFE